MKHQTKMKIAQIVTLSCSMGRRPEADDLYSLTKSSFEMPSLYFASISFTSLAVGFFSATPRAGRSQRHNNIDSYAARDTESQYSGAKQGNRQHKHDVGGEKGRSKICSAVANEPSERRANGMSFHGSVF
jgi:hypothetical protein